jgi:hypothetical protein
MTINTGKKIAIISAAVFGLNFFPNFIIGSCDKLEEYSARNERQSLLSPYLHEPIKDSLGNVMGITFDNMWDVGGCWYDERDNGDYRWFVKQDVPDPISVKIGQLESEAYNHFRKAQKSFSKSCVWGYFE